jgi:capsular polysaccharide biosynthesis protein
MDFIDSLRVLARQWRVLVVGIVIVLAASVGAIVAVPTNYQATGQLVMLLPPQATGTSSPTNPYLNLEPGLTVAASLVANTLSNKASARSLEAAGFTSDYAVGLSPDAGPVLQISAEDTDGAMAVRTRDEVMRRLQEELTRIQLAENAPPRQIIHARANSAPNVAEALPGSKIRALAAIGALGMVLTLMVAFIRERRGLLVRPEPRQVANSPEHKPSGPFSGEQPTPPASRTNGHRRRRKRQPVGAPRVNWWDS